MEVVYPDSLFILLQYTHGSEGKQSCALCGILAMYVD